MHIIFYFCLYHLLTILYEHHYMSSLEIYWYLITEEYLILWIYYNLFNQFPILGYLDCTQFFIL